MRDVTFEQVDISEQGSHMDERQKYGISGIPAVVFLDGSGNMLYSGHPAFSEEQFEAQINQFK